MEEKWQEVTEFVREEIKLVCLAFIFFNRSHL